MDRACLVRLSAALGAAALAFSSTAYCQRNLSAGAAGGSDKKVALVIGNSDYQRPSWQLRNPVNDAQAMAERLEAMGFIVVHRNNLQLKEIGATLREFRSKLSPGSTALFFYAGHGTQVNGNNYFPTVDSNIQSEDDVPTASLQLSQVLDVMEKTGTRIKIVLLDACRDNPFARTARGGSRGLAPVDAKASGMLISYATRPGRTADDGNSKNDLYTEFLLKHMDEPGLAVEMMLKKVGMGVKQASRGKQEPWTEGLIEGDFYFRPGPQMASTTPAASWTSPAPTRIQSATEIEQELWDSIKDSRSPGKLKAYLEQYPNGQFAAVARARLESTVQPATPAPPASAGPLVAPNGNRYEGDFDKAGGKGIIRLADGGRYEGRFDNGLPNGEGVFNYASGHVYRGSFQNGVPHGSGTSEMGGDRYVGEFANGIFHGKGTLRRANGDFYEGDFRDGKMNGKGQYRIAGGDSYVGDLSDGLSHGRGILTLRDGGRYEGEFQSGKFSGKGVYGANGSRYEGDFRDNQFHGLGKLILSNGEKRIGQFANGKFVAEVTLK